MQMFARARQRAGELLFQDEDRDLSRRLGLVFRVGRKGFDGPLPPLVALGSLEFASPQVAILSPSCSVTVGFALMFAYHAGCSGAPPWDATMA